MSEQKHPRIETINALLNYIRAGVLEIVTNGVVIFWFVLIVLWNGYELQKRGLTDYLIKYQGVLMFFMGVITLFLVVSIFFPIFVYVTSKGQTLLARLELLRSYERNIIKKIGYFFLTLFGFLASGILYIAVAIIGILSPWLVPGFFYDDYVLRAFLGLELSDATGNWIPLEEYNADLEKHRGY